MNINQKSKVKHLTASILVILAENPHNRRDIDTEQLQDFPGFTIDMFRYIAASAVWKEKA